MPAASKWMQKRHINPTSHAAHSFPALRRGAISEPLISLAGCPIDKSEGSVKGIVIPFFAYFAKGWGMGIMVRRYALTQQTLGW